MSNLQHISLTHTHWMSWCQIIRTIELIRDLTNSPQNLIWDHIVGTRYLFFQISFYLHGWNFQVDPIMNTKLKISSSNRHRTFSTLTHFQSLSNKLNLFHNLIKSIWIFHDPGVLYRCNTMYLTPRVTIQECGKLKIFFTVEVL